MSIPKKIHYVWLGDAPLPERDAEFIEGWRRLNPEFSVRHWTEKDVDLARLPIVAQALRERQWALASDAIRMFAVYSEGGIYMDTDVELLKPLAPFLKYDGFGAWENKFWFTTSIFGARRRSPWVGKLLRRFEVVEVGRKISTDTFLKTVHAPSVYAKDIYGVKLGGKTQEYAGGRFATFAPEYFAPKHYMVGDVRVTDNTVAFHHYASTWHSWRQKLENDAARATYRTLGARGYEKLERKYARRMERKIRKELA